MIDLLMVGGVALCVISVVLAIVSVVRTQAPRTAAVAFVLGILAVVAGNYLDARPFGVASVTDAWGRLVGGESFGTDTVTAPPPVVSDAQVGADASTQSEPAPQSAMHATDVPAPPGTEAPAATTPATTPATNP